jgi:hypothetical protein
MTPRIPASDWPSPGVVHALDWKFGTCTRLRNLQKTSPIPLWWLNSSETRKSSWRISLPFLSLRCMVKLGDGVLGGHQGGRVRFIWIRGERPRVYSVGQKSRRTSNDLLQRAWKIPPISCSVGIYYSWRGWRAEHAGPRVGVSYSTTAGATGLRAPPASGSKRVSEQ